MKILLLGAAGFIGTNLTIELAKKTEDEITLVDRGSHGLHSLCQTKGSQTAG